MAQALGDDIEEEVEVEVQEAEIEEDKVEAEVQYDSDEWERWYLDHPADRPVPSIQANINTILSDEEIARLPKCRQKKARADAEREKKRLANLAQATDKDVEDDDDADDDGPSI